MAIGASENASTCCPTHRVGWAEIRSASVARARADRSDGTTEAPRPVGRMIIESRFASTCARSRSRPHQNVGADVSASGSPSNAFDSAGRNGNRPGFSSTPLPMVLTTVTVPRRQASVNPTTPSRESGRSASGSDHSASTRRTTTSTGSYRPGARIQSRPPRIVRSALSTSGSPSRVAIAAWSNAVSECVPGLSTTTRGSSAAVGATDSSASRTVWK